MNQILINTVQGNKNYSWGFTITDSAGAVVNLTGAILKFNAQMVSDRSVNFSGMMSIVSAVAGTCKYVVQATDFEVPGTYNCQIEIDFSGGGGEVITVPGIDVEVEASVPIP